MKSGLLHGQTTAGTLSANSCYELDAERYPSLGNEFFSHLRQKYPRAFRRSIPRDVEKASVRYSTSSEDSKSVWSLWDCNGDDPEAVMKEAGGMLIPRCDLSVHERLKRISDSFSSVKLTGGDLLTTLRNFRSALLADNSSCLSFQHGMENISQADSGNVVAHGSFYGCVDAASNPSTSNSVSNNSSCEASLLRDLPKDDTVPCISSVPSASCEMQQRVVDTVYGADATLNSLIAEHDEMPGQSVDGNDCNPDINSTLLEEDAENQLPSTDMLRSFSSDVAMPVDHDQTHTKKGLVK